MCLIRSSDCFFLILIVLRNKASQSSARKTKKIYKEYTFTQTFDIDFNAQRFEPTDIAEREV